MEIRRICLYGASGVGKSTAALAITAELKKRNIDVEYINEFAKEWAMEDRKPDPYDQLFIGHSQYYRELRALRKHQLIVTDSPLWLAQIYLYYYSDKIKDEKEWMLLSEPLEAMSKLMDYKYPSTNLILPLGNFPYDSRARFQTEEEARRVEELIIKKIKGTAIHQDDAVNHVITLLENYDVIGQHT